MRLFEIEFGKEKFVLTDLYPLRYYIEVHIPYKIKYNGRVVKEDVYEEHEEIAIGEIVDLTVEDYRKIDALVKKKLRIQCEKAKEKLQFYVDCLNIAVENAELQIEEDEDDY